MFNQLHELVRSAKNLHDIAKNCTHDTEVKHKKYHVEQEWCNSSNFDFTILDQVCC